MSELTISLLTQRGLEIFDQAGYKGTYWPVATSFLTQETQTFCGVASSVCVLNALPVAKPVTPPYAPHAYFTQDNYFSDAVERIAPREQVLQEGMTLRQITSALGTWNVACESYYASNESIEELREQVQEVCSNSKMALIFNFYRPGLGQEGGGHFSPIGAYDRITDSVLLMDVARYKYPPVWVTLEVIYNAMNTIDSSSQLSRGWVRCWV